MTRINKLELYGFKSFAHKTEIILSDSFNCILGPNGSGKSNIGDAICFVLGKTSSKSMRAEKSAHLLYNGGKKGEPSKFAEVSIYFDNSNQTFPINQPQIKISRKVNKKGTSTYKINDEKRTRRQILELLNKARIDPDGYNIVLQGDIVRFIEMSPIEKRQLIEEISGISIYEQRKEKATRELEKVDEQLNSAEIVLKERGTYLKELKKDRDQALKYKELNDKIHHNQASYYRLQREKKELSLEEIKKKKSKLNKEAEEYNEEIDQFKKEIEDKKASIKQLSEEIEEKGEKDQVELTKEIEKLSLDIGKSKNRIEACKNEISRIDQRKTQLEKNQEEIAGKIARLKNEKQEKEEVLEEQQKSAEELQNKISSFKQKHNLDKDLEEVEKQVQELDAVIEEKQKQANLLREKQHDYLREKDKIEFQIKTFEEKISKLTEVKKENQEQLEALEKMRQELQKTVQELEELIDNDSKTALELGAKKKELNSQEEKLSKLMVKKSTIQESLMVDPAVRTVLGQRSKIKGIHGTIADLGEVPEKYSLALEVAAGPRLKSIVVENDKTASQAIEYLKRTRAGVATFLPLNKIRSTDLKGYERFKKEKGVIGFAVELLNFEEKFKKAFSYVFGETLVVENLETARKYINKLRLVTLDGELVERSGAMQGGHRKRKHKLKFKEKGLGEDITKVERRKSKLSQEVKELSEEREKNEGRIQELRKRRGELEGETIKLEKSLHLDSSDFTASQKAIEELEKELAQTEKDIDNIVDKISEVNKELAETKIKKQQIREKISQLKNPAVVAELNTFEEKQNEIGEKINELKNEIKNRETQISTILNPELENVRKITKQHQKEQQDFKKEVDELKKLIKEQEKELKEKREEEKKFSAKFKNLLKQRDKWTEEIDQNEDKIDSRGEKLRKVEHQLNNLSLEEAKLRAEMAGLDEQYAEVKEMKVKITKTEEELKKEIKEFEKMKEKIGSVNMRALEIYETVKKEFEKLLEKKNSLLGEKESVLGMIKEIETNKKGLFMKTFKAINENFIRIFHSISPKGGDAYLYLENEENPFEAGLNIKVKLTTKSFMDLRSLSGGEKTLTSLGLIFAIQEHEPASFYILDEVDAALDKSNSEKFSKLIRSYTENAQYLIISHNDAVISESDTLYGVSMNEQGKSKVVSLKL